jgi:hypothetical protein
LKQVIATVVVQSSEGLDQSSSMFEGPDIFLLLFIYPVEQQAFITFFIKLTLKLENLMCKVMNGLSGCDDLYEF